MKDIRHDKNGFLNLNKPWMVIGSILFLLAGVSVWFHNGGFAQDTFFLDIYSFSPVIAGVAGCIFISGWNIGFKNDWRWMVLMLVLIAVFWYSVPMGNLF